MVSTPVHSWRAFSRSTMKCSRRARQRRRTAGRLATSFGLRIAGGGFLYRLRVNSQTYETAPPDKLDFIKVALRGEVRQHDVDGFLR
jgi:hypothetical protein